MVVGEEEVVEALEGDEVVVGPEVDLGLMGPAAVAEGEPDFGGEVAEEEEGGLGGGGEGGDVGGGEEGEDAQLDVFREVGEEIGTRHGWIE